MVASFNDMVEIVLDAMEKHARDIKVEGVAVLAWLELAEKSNINWVGRMRVIDKILIEAQNDNGYNFVGMAWSKAAEMMVTKQNSGTTDRVYLNGEVGYRGGAISRVGNGYLIAAFSGGSTDEDFEISLAGIKAFQE